MGNCKEAMRELYAMVGMVKRLQKSSDLSHADACRGEGGGGLRVTSEQLGGAPLVTGSYTDSSSELLSTSSH